MEKLIDQLNWHNLINKLKLILKELSKSAGSEVVVENISDASVIGKSVLKSENAQSVRTLIGAGTSNLTVGATATTAKAGDWTPPDVTTTVKGLMLATDKVKLNGVATEATKNQTDTYLLSRANHTGTQAISTITGTVPIAQIPTGTTATTVSLGNHTHAFSTITGTLTISQIPTGSTATTVKLGNYTPSATEIVTAINAMTSEQVTAVQTKLGITPTP